MNKVGSAGRLGNLAWLRSLPSRAVVLRASLACIVALAAGAMHVPSQSRLNLSFEMASTTGPNGEVFSTNEGSGYAQDRSKQFPIVADGSWRAYQIVLPPNQIVDRVRIDPGNSEGQVAIRLLELEEEGNVQRLHGAQLTGALGLLHDMQPQSGQAKLALASAGGDPYFEIKLPRRMGTTGRAMDPGALTAFGIAALLSWLLLELSAARLSGVLRLPRLTLRVAQRISAIVSDDQVLRFSTPMVLAFTGIVASAALYVALGLNQTSLGVWETAYPDHPVEQSIDLGIAKRVRSDEWMVQTPWVLNQVLNGSRITNPNVGGESAPLLSSMPVSDAIGLPQLKYAGFRFLGLDRGLSWAWAYKTFALAWSFLWLLLILTKGNLTASVLGAGWVYFSSYTQWWFSSNLPEIMIAFALGVTGAIYAFRSAQRTHVVMGCMLIFYAATNLILNLYPPFIVPLAYLGIAILCGYLIASGNPGSSQRARFRVAAIVVTTALIAVYGYAFIGMASDSIQAMLDTVYPGKRVSASGGVPIAKGIYGFYEVFRSGELDLPMRPTNASEASSFVLLWPMILLLLPGRTLLRRENALLLACACFCIVASLWMLLSMPSHLQWLMQKAGWSLVTPKRTIMALGVGSVLGCTVLFSRMQERNDDDQRILRGRILALVIVSIGVLALGWKLHQIDQQFFSRKVLLIGASSAILVAAGIALGRTRLLVAGLTIYALPTFGINPLVSGISSISQKPILLAAASQSKQHNDKWVAVGDKYFAQGLKAHGLNVFGGAQFLPDRRSLSVLDPSNRYQGIWNRYAIVQVISNPRSHAVTFRKMRGDQYSITLNVCGEELRRMGITHVAYTVQVPAKDLACLVHLPAPENSGVSLFKLRH